MKYIGVCILGFILSASASWAAEGPKTFQVSGFTFERPADWEWVQTRSSMRKAELKVLDGEKKGDPLEVVFFYFGPSDGGGTQANVDRWFGQFKEPKDALKSKVESSTVGGHKLTYVHAEGTFMSGSPFGPKTPKAGYRLVGAILEDTQGSVFVKLTGPSQLAESSTGAFKTMVEGALK